MEVVRIRVNVREGRKVTMNRFLNGLNPQIIDGIEQHHYLNMNDMFMVIKVEK